MADTQKRHEELHQALDELLACYFVTTKRLISNTPLMDFLKWSYTMTENATCQVHDGKHPEVAEVEVDFQAVFCDLSTLLDAIEKALGEGDAARAEELVKGRFDLVEKHGLTVEFTGMPAGAGDN